MTIVLKVNAKSPDKAAIAFAASIIKAGGLVAFPTETVYGIAANLLNKRAMTRLCAVKKRPNGKPFTVHISGENMIKAMGCKVTREARLLMNKFWPGPLTMIMRSRNGKKIGFRMPANRIALELIKAAGVPVVAPSANLSGNRPPKTAAQVMSDLGENVEVLIDSGRTNIGVESTVIDLTVRPPKILREGAIKLKDILKAMTNVKAQMTI